MLQIGDCQIGSIFFIRIPTNSISLQGLVQRKPLLEDKINKIFEEYMIIEDIIPIWVFFCTYYA